MFVAICWLYMLFSRHPGNLKFWCLQELYLVIWDVTKLDGNKYSDKIVICSKCLSCVSNECCKCQWAQQTACCILMFWNNLFVLYFDIPYLYAGSLQQHWEWTLVICPSIRTRLAYWHKSWNCHSVSCMLLYILTSIS